MTDAQLYVAIGVPLLFNSALFGLLMIYINGKFADARDIWTSELRRVEEVLDARMKHLETK